MTKWDVIWHTLWELDERSWIVSVPRHLSERVFIFSEMWYNVIFACHCIFSFYFNFTIPGIIQYDLLSLNILKRKLNIYFSGFEIIPVGSKTPASFKFSSLTLGLWDAYETWQILLWQCHYDLSSQMTELKARDCNFKGFTSMMSHSRRQHNQRGRVSERERARAILETEGCSKSVTKPDQQVCVWWQAPLFVLWA